MNIERFCAGYVHEEVGVGYRVCTRTGRVEEGGKWWCRQHAPSAVRARQNARDEKGRAAERVRVDAHAEGERLREMLAAIGFETAAVVWDPDKPSAIRFTYDQARAAIAKFGGAS